MHAYLHCLSHYPAGGVCRPGAGGAGRGQWRDRQRAGAHCRLRPGAGGAVCARSLQRLFLRRDAAVLFRHRGDRYRRLQQRQQACLPVPDGAGGGLRPRGDEERASIWRSPTACRWITALRNRWSSCSAGWIPCRFCRCSSTASPSPLPGFPAHPHAGRSHWPLHRPPSINACCSWVPVGLSHQPPVPELAKADAHMRDRLLGSGKAAARQSSANCASNG